jgi:hypothetical protein
MSIRIPCSQTELVSKFWHPSRLWAIAKYLEATSYFWIIKQKLTSKFFPSVNHWVFQSVLSLNGVFQPDSKVILERLPSLSDPRDDIRIFYLFYPPEETHNLLCFHRTRMLLMSKQSNEKQLSRDDVDTWYKTYGGRLMLHFRWFCELLISTRLSKMKFKCLGRPLLVVHLCGLCKICLTSSRSSDPIILCWDLQRLVPVGPRSKKPRSQTRGAPLPANRTVKAGEPEKQHHHHLA